MKPIDPTAETLRDCPMCGLPNTLELNVEDYDHCPRRCTNGCLAGAFVPLPQWEIIARWKGGIAAAPEPDDGPHAMTDREIDAWVYLALFGIESCSCRPGGQSGRKFARGPDGRFVCSLCGKPAGCPDFTGSRSDCDMAEQKIAELGLEVQYGIVINMEAGKHLPGRGPFILATLEPKTRCLAMYQIKNHIAAARSSANE